MPEKNKKNNLIKGIAKELDKHQKAFGNFPCINIDDAKRILSHVLGIIFPHYLPGCERGKAALEKELATLEADLLETLVKLTDWDDGARHSKITQFLADLPGLAKKVSDDATALYNSDPASKSLEEVILAYPGCYAVSAYRIAHYLLGLEIPLLPRLMSEYAHRLTGIDIHPGAKIGHALHIDHGTGVVIGETAIIGNHVQIYQGVTLGALKVDKKESDKKRHPTIEDHVVLYSGATILGGKTVIGHDSTIGGNVWITKSILPHSRVMYRSTDEAESGLNWTI